MSNKSRLLLITIFTPMVASLGCVHDLRSEQFDTCVFGSECVLEGKLSLNPGAPAWAALLEAGDQCAKLALPDSFYADANKWDGKKVMVRGRAFRQPGMAVEGGVLFWYKEKERKLAFGMCDGGIGVYVESIRSSSGELWSAPAD